MKHFAQIEKEYHQKAKFSIYYYAYTKQHRDQKVLEDETLTLEYCLPGETEPIFIVTPTYLPSYETKASEVLGTVVFSKIYDFTKLSHIYYSIRGGFDGVRKILDYDKQFFEYLFKFMIDTNSKSVGPELTLHRIDWCSDYTQNLLTGLIESIRLNHYNSGKKSITVYPKNFWEDVEQADIDKGVKASLKPSSRSIGTRGDGRRKMTEQDWNNIQTIYVGNAKHSDIQIAIYNKQAEQLKRKGLLNSVQTRVEVREKNLGRPSSAYKKEKEPKLQRDIRDYQAIFRDYDSTFSKGMRSLYFCDTLLDHFTLTKNTRVKTELKPWYVDVIYTAHEKIMECYLVPHLKEKESTLEQKESKESSLI